MRELVGELRTLTAALQRTVDNVGAIQARSSSAGRSRAGAGQ
jgi:hypothetical protein